MIIYLYVKTHKTTGLKYLGKTVRDPHKYKGSGKYWIRHLKEHGNDVKTEILRECKNEEELKVWGLYYSKLFNVVEDDGWANLMYETGDGGDTSNSENYKKSITERDVSGEKNGMFGRSAVIEKNLKWYTDGFNTIYVQEGTQPAGFYRGRTLGKRAPATEKTKQLISKSNTGREKQGVQVISPDGTSFRTIKLAAKSLNLTVSAFRYHYENKNGWTFIFPK